MRGRGPPAFLQTRRCFSRCVTNKSLGRCLNFDLFQDTSGKNSWSWIAYLQDSPSFIFVDPFLLKIKDFVFCIFVSELIGVGTGAQKRGGGTTVATRLSSGVDPFYGIQRFRFWEVPL